MLCILQDRLIGVEDFAPRVMLISAARLFEPHGLLPPALSVRPRLRNIGRLNGCPLDPSNPRALRRAGGTDFFEGERLVGIVFRHRAVEEKMESPPPTPCTPPPPVPSLIYTKRDDVAELALRNGPLPVALR